MANIKTLEVTAKLGSGYKIESRIRNHVVYIDQTKAGGGDDSAPTPLEYLFLSLAGCVGSIGRIIAKQRKLSVRSMEVRVTGELDTDILMGKAQEHRPGFMNIRVTASIDADMSDEEKRQFLHDIDLRCPVSDNLKFLTPVSVELEKPKEMKSQQD